MGEMVICICTNLFRVYIVYRFFKAFFGKARVDRKIEFFFYSVYFIVNTGLYIGFHLGWLNIVNSLIGIVLLSLLYTISIQKGLFVALLIYVLNMICDIVSAILFVSFKDDKNTSQILFVIGNLLFLIIELAIEKIVEVRKNEKHNILPLMLIPFCSILIILFMTYRIDVLKLEILIVGIGLLIINFLVLHLYNALIKALSNSYKNQILAQNASMYLNQLNLIKQNEEQMATFRHDMRHHLMELKILAESGNKRKMQNYIQSMEQYIQNSDEIICSGNTDIDSLLNYILKDAEEKLKVVDIKVQIPPDIPNQFDINIVLGNILENAIEAADKTEEKVVRGSIVLKKGVLQIKIENSYNGVLIKENHRFLTTKERKENHGIGLKSVSNTLEKYNGVMDISNEDFFCVNVIMYIPDEDKNE